MSLKYLDRRWFKGGLGFSSPLDFAKDVCSLGLPNVSLRVGVAVVRYPQMSSTSSCTLPKLPSRTTSRVRSAKKRSTRFSHELLVGMKCSSTRLA